MHVIISLLVFPIFIAITLLFVKNDTVRSRIVGVTALVIFLVTLVLFIFSYHRDVQYYKIPVRMIDKGMFFVELLLGAYIFFLGLRFKERRVAMLILAQNYIMILWRLFSPGAADLVDSLFIDRLTIILCLVIGLIGSPILFYSIGYMRDYHASYKEIKDNRRFYFFIVFVFISAMFGLVLSNNLSWIYFFWELTTLSSFFLIGYSNINAQAARKNAFRALEFNLWGGVAFSLAIFYFYTNARTLELDDLFMAKKATVILPVTLLCLAGLIKSAQFPFSSWLLGAMVAPTPVSALLHSSAMVKAGIYIILRFALILQNSMQGFLISLIGGFTFLIASLIAISQSDAKKVLAYSTIANLGLICLCAGMGTYEAIWAAVLLLIFHALTKCLLFLCVGTIQDKLKTRNIEDMSGLIVTMPKLSVMIELGIAGMFLAPFGMLISKWAVLKAIVDYHPIFSLFIVFGSAAMIFFWLKWLGRLIVIKDERLNLEKDIGLVIWAPLYILSILTIGAVLFMPFVSNVIIEPFIMEMYGKMIDISHDNVVIMMVMMGMVMLFPLAFLRHSRKARVVKPYLSGANAQANTAFYAGFGQIKNMQMSSYYPEEYFSEKILFRLGLIIAVIIILALFAITIL